MRALIAVHNASIGYQWAKEALSLAAAGEQDIILWPPALSDHGGYFRTWEDTYKGRWYYLGARWTRGRVGGQTARAYSITEPIGTVLDRIGPDVVYLVQPPGLPQQDWLRAAAEAKDITVREFKP